MSGIRTMHVMRNNDVASLMTLPQSNSLELP